MKRPLVPFAALVLILSASAALAQGRLSPQGGVVVGVDPASGGGVVIGGTAARPSVGLATSCTATQVLAWTGSAWACADNGSGDITSVGATAGGGLTGGATTGAALLGLITTCSSGQLLKWSGSSWGCADDNNSGGDITDVVAGAGLVTGGTSGSVTVDVGAGLGIAVNADDVAIDPTYTQRRVSSSCSAGTSIRAIAQDGTVTCETDDDSGGDITSVGTNFPLSGGASSGAVGLSLATCSANQIYKMNGAGTLWACSADSDTTYTASAPVSLSAGAFGLTACSANQVYKENGTGTGWVCSADADSGGDITGVTAGTGLTGGATSGNATLTLNMTAQSCSAGQHISAATATGTFTCSADTALSGLTSTHIPKATGSTTIADSPMTVNANGTFSIPTPSAGDALTAAGSVTTSGPINASGGASWIQAGAQVYAFSGNTTLQNKGISFDYNTNGASGGEINAVGYADGTTQPRDLTIKNGMGASIMKLEGSTKHVYYYGSANLGTCSGGSLAGNDTDGFITTPDNTCTVNFGGSYTTNAPVCTATVQNSTAVAVGISAVSPSSVTFVMGTKPSGLHYHCSGRL